MPDVALREETDADLAFLQALYASTREEELARVAWDAPDKARFVAHQFALQREQYRHHYPGAEFLVIERGAPAGRMYLHRGGAELRLMEITLLPALRGAGLGTRLTRALLAYADAQDVPVTLHVEPFNPAYRLYRRLGFGWRRSTGVYHFLQRTPGAREIDERDVLSRWPS